MQTTDLQCIKYVMNEMDPTERAQFEEDMRSDPNILIEVECFKRTLFKIQEGKSETEVPPELTQVIQAKARQNARKEKVFRLFKQAPVRYSAAAALLITAFLFGISFNSSNNSRPTDTNRYYRITNQLSAAIKHQARKKQYCSNMAGSSGCDNYSECKFRSGFRA